MLELNKIYCWDCLELMKQIDDNSIDLIITSPPYNKNWYRGKKDTSKWKWRWGWADIKYSNYDDNMQEEEYKQRQIKILNECYRILAPMGSIFYNHKIRRTNNQASNPIERILQSNCKFYQQIVWDRWWWCDHNVWYLDPNTEYIYRLTKDVPKVFKKDCRFQTEIWRFNPDINNSHPAPFPEEFVQSVIQLTTEKWDIVFDPFMWSWTTAVWCKQMHRNFIGADISQEYVDMANKRLETTTVSLF